MEHFITQIHIENLRYLSNIDIVLNPNKRQHLLLTGKNGSGKTTVLAAIRDYLSAINDGRLNALKETYPKYIKDFNSSFNSTSSDGERFNLQNSINDVSDLIHKYTNGLTIDFNYYSDLDMLYHSGNFLTAFFPASRKTNLLRSDGVENVVLQQSYNIDEEPGNLLLKYMIHLKTQQSYAKNENNFSVADMIQKWFDRFENALRLLLDEDMLTLEYDYKNYNFKIKEHGKTPFSFDELSDGYSSLIFIVSDLILRMDKNWLLRDDISTYDIEGIVLIDELETHLHIELQRKILPFLTEFFPRLQFIVSTHSPYILNSISNARVYDLEKEITLENLSGYSSEGIVEGYFENDNYSDILFKKLQRYEQLTFQSHLSDNEKAERAALRIDLKKASSDLAPEVRDAFKTIENKRKQND